QHEGNERHQGHGVADRSEPVGTNRSQREISDAEEQVGKRESSPEAEPISDCSANYRQKPDPSAEHPGETAGTLDIEVQVLVQIASEHGKDRVIRKPLKKFADVGNPEWPLKSFADFANTFRER